VSSLVKNLTFLRVLSLGLSIEILSIEKLSGDPSKITIYESFKENDNILEVLENLSNKDTLNFNDSDNKREILRFY